MELARKKARVSLRDYAPQLLPCFSVARKPCSQQVLVTFLKRPARIDTNLTAFFNSYLQTLLFLADSASTFILFSSKYILTMPKVFLIKRKKLVPNWCPVTPPPSPDDDETVPENLSMKTSASSHTDSLIAAAISARQGSKSLSFMPALLPPPPINAHSASIAAHHHHLAHNLHHNNTQHSVLNLKRSLTHEDSLDEPCAVDLSVSAKTDTSSNYSPQHYSRSSSLSSPFSYSASESEFEIKGKLSNSLTHYSFVSSFALTHSLLREAGLQHFLLTPLYPQIRHF